MHNFTIHSLDIPLNINDTATCLLKSYGVGFYISSSPSNIANAITSLESHSTLQVFHLLHFYPNLLQLHAHLSSVASMFSSSATRGLTCPPSGILWPATPSLNPSAICTTSPSHTQHMSQISQPSLPSYKA
ncbi:uncharacterized protein ACA1_304720 [Acanthamoeba castellanii str. Neff]|uniref:Uncharacterized protein n=1 Tax=Acanthamoeba castellanii (strain ATCC 30010 / Neff) TaxID=1257118 RepID=L8HE55_ACACF|nr:uncharacterized protein ACA1_304720 [Acanthamoeba castellanii str. Neff]ELR23819.1 hypothetical protein ACA1_304720 [Acanthamoeba castellanii str. Neff]